ncbi:hypothetical protein Hanom_Chr10g00943901 [Helianthus anomalus]
MELASRMKMARFQTFWIRMRKNNPLDKSCKTSQTSGTKMAFYSLKYNKNLNSLNLPQKRPSRFRNLSAPKSTVSINFISFFTFSSSAIKSEFSDKFLPELDTCSLTSVSCSLASFVFP